MTFLLFLSCVQQIKSPDEVSSENMSTAIQNDIPQEKEADKTTFQRQLMQPVMGINEAVSVPRALVLTNKVSPSEVKTWLENEVSLTLNLGAQTVRANSHTYPYLNHHDAKLMGNWQSRMDVYVQLMQANNIEPIMVIGPWPGIQTASFTSHYLPDDMTRYVAWVSSVVERYDGDGTEDMPGLKTPIIYWEIDNEPDLHNHRPPRGRKQNTDPSQFETPSEYATVLKESSKAIRSANPSAKVIFGGLASVTNDHGKTYLKKVLEQPQTMDSFDIISVHSYINKPVTKSIEMSYHVIRELVPLKPIWLTETGAPSDGSKPWATETKQAEVLFEIYTKGLQIGFDRIYWHTLRTPKVARGPFASHGLLDSPSTNNATKPAGEMYKALAPILSKSEWVSAPSLDFQSNLGSFQSENEGGQNLVPTLKDIPKWAPSTNP
jgi:hypothetical protein